MKFDPLDPAVILLGGIALLLLILVGTFALAAIPFAVAGYVGWSMYTASKQQHEDQAKADELKERVVDVEQYDNPNLVITAVREMDNPNDYAGDILWEMMQFERPPEPPEIHGIDWEARKPLKEYLDKYDNAKEQCAQLIATTALQLDDLLDLAPEQGTGTLQIRGELQDFVDVKQCVYNLANAYFSQELVDTKAAQRTRDVLERNLYRVSKVPLDGQGTLILPNQFKGDDRECIEEYLKGTPLKRAFQIPVHLAIPEKTRFEHVHILGSTGSGKTTLLKEMIARDIEQDASIVVLDSQGELIPNIARTESIKDRLILIDAADTQYPVQLNPFHIRGDSTQTRNTAIEFLTYLMGAVLGADLTSKQGTLFRYVIRLLLTIEDSTIFTLKDLFQAEREQFRSYIAKLDDTPREFFEQEFWGREFKQTREQVLRRIWTVLENEYLTSMFTQPEPTLDLGKEMAVGKVILIDARKSFLRQTGVEIFGRTVIALMAMAIQERSGKSKPCYFYCDEAQDYFGEGDQYITQLLEQARKQKVSVTLSHQALSQMPHKVIESLHANTAIKFANTTAANDARAMASNMRCHADFILNQPKLHFACFAKGTTPQAMTYETQFNVLENMERLSDTQWKDVRNAIREQYGRTAPKTSKKTQEEEVNTAPQEW